MRTESLERICYAVKLWPISNDVIFSEEIEIPNFRYTNNTDTVKFINLIILRCNGNFRFHSNVNSKEHQHNLILFKNSKLYLRQVLGNKLVVTKILIAN